MSVGRARSGGIVTTSNCKAIKQIGPERSASRERRQIDVRSADHPHVDLNRPTSANPLHLAVLDDPEHLLLHRGRRARNFVEQQTPAVRSLEAAHVLALRAGECARFVAKKLRVEQRFRKRRTIDLDQGPVPARREVVQARREQLLSGASFAHHETRAVDRREAGDLLLDFQEGGVFSEDGWSIGHRSRISNFDNKWRIR